MCVCVCVCVALIADTAEAPAQTLKAADSQETAAVSEETAAVNEETAAVSEETAETAAEAADASAGEPPVDPPALAQPRAPSPPSSDGLSMKDADEKLGGDDEEKSAKG